MPRPKKPNTDSPASKRVTLKDVANAAGLHVMTVSDALGNKRIVAPATRERVKRIARELNYIPNPMAKALSTGRTSLIAIMCGSLHEVYYANLVAYLEKCLRGDGYHPILLRHPGDLKEFLEATSVTAVDGAISVDGHIERMNRDTPVPCVCIGAYPRPFVDYVVIDLSVAVSAALNIMVGAGRKRIAYVVTAAHMANPEESRADAYFASVKQAGLNPEIINVATNVLTEVEPQLKAYIEHNGCPDGLLCQNDETAMSAYRALRDLGFRIPEDVLVVGCDGQLHMKYFDAPLSTIVQPLEDICNMAWKFLKNRIEDPTLPQQRSVLGGELVVRDSLMPRLMPHRGGNQRPASSTTSLGSIYPGRE